MFRLLQRFIPTGVGNMGEPASRILLQAVHPHRRGEHALFRASLPLPFGSSPQAWGTSLISLEFFLKFRFIPTGVGNIPL